MSDRSRGCHNGIKGREVATPSLREHTWVEVTSTTDLYEDRARKYVCVDCGQTKAEPVPPRETD